MKSAHLLLTALAFVFIWINPCRAASGPSEADHALWAAVQNRSTAAVAAALAAGADPNSVDPASTLSQPPLEKAIEGGAVAVADLLLSSGANVRQSDSYGYTALLETDNKTPVALVQRMLNMGADVNQTGYNGVPLLSRCCALRRYDLLPLLLSRGARANAPGADGSTALMIVAEAGRVDVAKLLIAHGASVHTLNRRHASALTTAVGGHDDNIQMLRFLLHRGLNVNQQSSDWTTSLQAAALFGNPKNMAFLIAHGADVRGRSPEGKTAWTYAKEGEEEFGDTASGGNYPAIYALLRSAGVQN